MFVFCPVTDKSLTWVKMCVILCGAGVALARGPSQVMVYWWGAWTHNRALLTATTTLSSPWNLGRNRSPRTTSDWLRGRKRHSTFMLHSAGTSAIAQIQRGGRMLLLWGGKMLPKEAGGESLPSGAWTDGPNKRRSDSLAVRTDSEEGRKFRWFSPGG